VGSSVNRYLLDEMGAVGRGFARYIDPTKDIEETAIRFANYLSMPVLTDVNIDWGTLKPSQLTPKTLPDLFIGDSLRILGKFQQQGEHIVKVTGLINGTKASLPLKINTHSPNANSQSIPLIWARSQIKDRMREFSLPARLKIRHDVNNEQIKQSIITLGLEHSLMTRWTAFIAVSDQQVNPKKVAKDTQIPLPMPAGVSPLAYKGSNAMSFAGSSTPEPSILRSLLLMSMILGIVLWYRRLGFKISRLSKK
jgi:Ca-activated chloride channel family protein